jgi:hypothetical protein
MVADRDLYLALELEKAGILKAGDRIRILKALTRRCFTSIRVAEGQND